MCGVTTGPRVRCLAAIAAALLIAPVLAEGQGRGHTSHRAGNTLQICHTLGNGGVRMLNVDPSARADHLGHGDWDPITLFEDQDDDRFGGKHSLLACVLSEGYSDNDMDCDDADPSSYPGAPEIAGDNRDNDCDGWIDEGWPSWGEAATTAARQAALSWMSGAGVRSESCHVNAAIATAGPFSVTGPSVEGKVKKALLDAGASASVASGWDAAFTQSWHGWSEAIMIPALPWYPTLSVWPGPYAPPTPNVSMPLSAMLSIGRSGMQASSLAERVASMIGNEADESGAGAAIHAFASDMAARFDASLQTPVTSVMGEGPVPAWYPPFMLVGPVIGGKCWGGAFPTGPWN